LEVPIDASAVPDLKSGQSVRVLAVGKDGSGGKSTVVKVDGKGHGLASFSFEGRPQSVRVIIGPEDATHEELQGLQTVSVDVSARAFEAGKPVRISPIRVSSYYWYWWLRWCRTFSIRGRVLCADGSPVPGATVCAFDVDSWWWWTSKQQVGCAVTDGTGSFQIDFRWCCGWWPWWWLGRRQWQLEPQLADAIVPVLQRDPRLKRIPKPSPQPSLEVFHELLATDAATAFPQRAALDPAGIASVREQLVAKLPVIPELSQLKLWPWFPWQPWWDCTPDVIFKVTQPCRGEIVTIVNESPLSARWNIPQVLDVTLTANERACCIPPTQEPPGDCVVITDVCGDIVDHIGGNPGAPASPAGYLNPGGAGSTGDRPYAGGITIDGQFGSGAVGADHYEFQWSSNGGATWNDMPDAAAGGFTRVYWGPLIGTSDPPGFHGVPWTFTTIDGHNVAETLRHFEANNDPLSWGSTRFWVNPFLLMVWLTENTFADGTYQLRIRTWRRAGANLQDPRILPLCDTESDNGLVLTLDNRVVGSGSGHPATHPCGSGTVHTCTREPDTHIVQVRVNGVPVQACDIVDATKGGPLDIDFYAHDPDGHLGVYSLIATYDVNLAINLLGLAGATLVPGPASGGIPSALQVGPDYGAARVQGAASPVWAGGVVTLHIPDLRQAFPESCAYQLELRGYKRTISGCDHNLSHNNLSEYSFTVKV
ncbi:MAG TPA: carboxypeptidase-like regulatory domain-containing protein, partial [Myxococcales bacterium]|nr:carboxypeptidase-like regulatory domain-containing protein [Myxococcales bacterium]